MDIGYLNDMVSPIACGIALVIGFLIKYTIPSNKINRFIPVICAVVGLVVVTVTDFIAGTFMESPMTSILMGLVSGLAATGLFEAFRNLFKIPVETPVDGNDVLIRDEDGAMLYAPRVKELESELAAKAPEGTD